MHCDWLAFGAMRSCVVLCAVVSSRIETLGTIVNYEQYGLDQQNIFELGITSVDSFFDSFFNVDFYFISC